MYEKVIIKQLADDNQAAINLAKYNRSRFPHCSDTFQVAQLSDGRYITGLDPNGPDVVGIKDEQERERIAEERQELATQLGLRLSKDLSSRSEFWSEFLMPLSTDQDLILNRSNPMHVVMYHALVANGYVAPSKEAASKPQYLASKYYCHVDDVEANNKVSTSKQRDQARAELYKIAENRDKMLLVGLYLDGTRYKKTMKENTLYSMLSDFIDDAKNPENVEKFIRTVKLPTEDLQYKVTIDTAIRKKIIRFRDGQYYRGGVNLGRNAVEVLKNLKMPDYANEFISIHEEVNGR